MIATMGFPRRAGAACVVLLAPTAAARAACTGQVLIDPTVRPLVYDPFQPGDSVMQGTVRVRQEGEEECRLRLGFYRSPDADVAMRQTSGARVGEGALRYELTGNGRRLVSDWPQNSAPPVFLVLPPLAGAGQSVEARYQLRIPRGQLAAPGSYADEIELRAYELDGNSPLALRALDLEAEIAPVVSLNLVGADVSSPFAYTMDFGVLETGERRSVGIEARSNGRYRLRVSSREGGVLRLDPPFETWTIAYSASLGGRRLDFPGTVGTYAPTAATGAVLPLQVVIGDVADKRAGIYRDEIAISIEPAP